MSNTQQEIARLAREYKALRSAFRVAKQEADTAAEASFVRTPVPKEERARLNTARAAKGLRFASVAVAMIDCRIALASVRKAH